MFLLLHIVLRFLACWKARGASYSLRLFLFNHFHYAAEAGRAQGTPARAILLPAILFLRNLWQHDLAVLVSLYDHVRDQGLNALIVAEGTSNSVDQGLGHRNI